MTYAPCYEETKTLANLFFNCYYSKLFWKGFVEYWYLLSNNNVVLSIQPSVYWNNNTSTL